MNTTEEKLTQILKDIVPKIVLSEAFSEQMGSLDMVSIVTEIEKVFAIEIEFADIKKGFLKDYATTTKIIEEKSHR